MDNTFNAVIGALVADASALGLHWLYDSEHIDTVASTGDLLFRAPDAAVYEKRKGVFVHHGKAPGDLSHYGESVRVVADLVLNDTYTTGKHRDQFNAAFGPCGSFRGYADRPTKQLIARIILEGEDLSDPSGMDDNQMPAFAVLPGLFAVGAGKGDVIEAAKVISVNNDVLEGISVAYDCLAHIQSGESLRSALSLCGTNATDSKLTGLLAQSLSISDYAPVAVSDQFGKACYAEHAMPVIWHILNHADSFETAIRDNIRCGGDTCGRGILLGALAGMSFGVPPGLIRKLSRGALPVNYNLSAVQVT